LDQLAKDLRKVHKQHTFEFGDEIPLETKFQVGLFRKKATYDANLILQSIVMHNNKSTKMHYVITEQLLVADKSFESSLYAGLCDSYNRILIMSTARLKNYDVILTVAHHELGHLFGLDHCSEANSDSKCIMKEGNHNIEVVSTNYWCEECWKKIC